MVAKTAAQFNSPLWQIENYSLVPPAGAINCVLWRFAVLQPRLESLDVTEKLCVAVEVKLVTIRVTTTAVFKIKSP